MRHNSICCNYAPPPPPPQMQPGVRRHAQAREEARGDALLAMPKGMLVLDVNIVHAPAVAFLEGTVATGSSADVDGAAAAIGGEGQGGRVPPRHRWRSVRVGARGDGVWRQAWQGLHARDQQARDDRGASPTGWRSMCSCAARKRRSV